MVVYWFRFLEMKLGARCSSIRKKCKIDRVLGSFGWHDRFPGCFLKGLSSALSDHCLLLLSTMVKAYKCKRFRFESFWAQKEGFLETVEKAWNNWEGEAISNPILRFNAKLKHTAKALRSWSTRNFGDIKKQIVWAKTIIG